MQGFVLCLSKPDVMNKQEDSAQPKCYQLDEIWQQVLRWVSFRESFYEVLLREYADLRTFNETSACICLRLFTESRRVRLHKRHLENSVTQAFRLSFQQALSQEFQVRFEVENIEDKQPPLQDEPLKLEQLLPFPLPSVWLHERRNLSNCPAVYFVLEDESNPNKHVLYVGMTQNLANRWKKHDKLQRFESRGSNIRIAWLECYYDESVISTVENLFIQLLEPEMNWIGLADERISNWTKLGYKKKVQAWDISNLLWIRGWDSKAIKQIDKILEDSVKIIQNQELFAAILKYAIADPNRITYQFTQLPIPENWIPCKDEIVLWVHDAKEVPCRFKRVRPMTGDKRLEATVDNCECEIIKIVTTETISSVNFLVNKYQRSFYVPLSELRPSQGLGLNVMEAVEAIA